MAELALTRREAASLQEMLAGSPKPEGVRPGTWFQLMRGTLDCLHMDELRAIAAAEPRVLAVLGIVGTDPRP